MISFKKRFDPPGHNVVVVHNAEPEFEPFTVSDLELVPLLRDGEELIYGPDMLIRAREDLGGNLGHTFAEYLFWELRDEIPEEWERYFLLFPGTEYKGASQNNGIPGMQYVFHKGAWGFVWTWIHWVPYFSNCRVVRLKNPKI